MLAGIASIEELCRIDRNGLQKDPVHPMDQVKLLRNCIRLVIEHHSLQTILGNAPFRWSASEITAVRREDDNFGGIKVAHSPAG